MRKIIKYSIAFISILLLTGCHKHVNHYGYDDENHYYECEECGEKTNFEAHTFTEKVLVEASCLTNGTSRFTCSKCGYVKVVDDIKGDHEYVNVVEVSPTHTKAGYSSYQVCKLCGDIKEEGHVIEPLGHDEELHYESDENNHYLKCSCGDIIDEGNHIYNYSSTEENGIVTMSCICGKTTTTTITELNEKVDSINNSIANYVEVHLALNRNSFLKTKDKYDALPPTYKAKVNDIEKLNHLIELANNEVKEIIDEVNNLVDGITVVSNAKNSIERIEELKPQIDISDFNDYKLYLSIKEAYDNYAALDLNSNELKIKALLNAAYSYYYQGTQIQYDQFDYRRNVHAKAEDATADGVIYLDCSSFVDALYYNVFGDMIITNFNYNDKSYSLSNGANVNTNYVNLYCSDRTRSDVIIKVDTSTISGESAKATKMEEFVSLLQPGDLINYRHNNNGSNAGHIMLYLGDNKIMHCTGLSNSFGPYDDPMDQAEEIATDDEKKIGGILIDDLSILTSPDGIRYLFKNAGGDKVTYYSILRPINRNLTLTEYGVSKLLNNGINYEKTVSVGNQKIAFNGETIEYTIELENKLDTDSGYIYVQNFIPNGIKNVVADNGYVSNNFACFKLKNVPGNSKVLLSYRGTVDANKGTKLLDCNSSVNYARMNMILNQVADKKFDSSDLIAKAITFVGEKYDYSVDAIRDIYQELGYSNVIPTAVTTDKYFLTNTLKNYKLNTEAACINMVAGIMYGGGGYANGSTAASDRGFKYYNVTNNDCTGYMNVDRLEPGDIIVTHTKFDSDEDEGDYKAYLFGSNYAIYGLEDGEFKLIYNDKTDIKEFAHSLPYYIRFIVIRPQLYI